MKISVWNVFLVPTPTSSVSTGGTSRTVTFTASTTTIVIPTITSIVTWGWRRSSVAIIFSSRRRWRRTSVTRRRRWTASVRWRVHGRHWLGCLGSRGIKTTGSRYVFSGPTQASAPKSSSQTSRQPIRNGVPTFNIHNHFSTFNAHSICSSISTLQSVTKKKKKVSFQIN